MTRAKEIMKEAEKVASANTKSIGDWSAHFFGFIHGAEWADAHPHWISIEDELPKEHEWILGFSLKRPYIDVYNFDSNGLIEAHDITHWMPLPQAPHHIIDANKKVDRIIGSSEHIKTALDVLNKEGGEK